MFRHSENQQTTPGRAGRPGWRQRLWAAYIGRQNRRHVIAVAAARVYTEKARP